MIEIPLTRGQITIVDNEDADLNKLRWHALFRPQYGDGGAYIARRTERHKGKQTAQLMHRVILARMLGRLLLQAEEVDHIDLNPLNNRRSNLRLATKRQNKTNQRTYKNNTSGYKGVSWNASKRKWHARISKEGKVIHLGFFDSPEEAYDRYCKAARELHGEFARVK